MFLLLLCFILLNVPLLSARSSSTQNTTEDIHKPRVKNGNNNNHSNDVGHLILGDDDYFYSEIRLGPFHFKLWPTHTPLARSEIAELLDKLESKIDAFMKEISFQNGAAYFSLRMLDLDRSEFHSGSPVAMKSVAPPGNNRRRSLARYHAGNRSYERILSQQKDDTTVIYMEGITIFFHQGDLPSESELINNLEATDFSDGVLFDTPPLSYIEKIKLSWSNKLSDINIADQVAVNKKEELNSKNSKGMLLLGICGGITLLSGAFVYRHFSKRKHGDEPSPKSITSELDGFRIIFNDSWKGAQAMDESVDICETPSNIFVPPQILDPGNQSDITNSTFSSEEIHWLGGNVVRNILPPTSNSSLIYSSSAVSDADPSWDPNDDGFNTQELENSEELVSPTKLKGVRWKTFDLDDTNHLASPTSSTDSFSYHGRKCEV